MLSGWRGDRQDRADSGHAVTATRVGLPAPAPTPHVAVISIEQFKNQTSVVPSSHVLCSDCFRLPVECAVSSSLFRTLKLCQTCRP